MYDILNKGRVHNLSVSCHLDLFDKIIIPNAFNPLRIFTSQKSIQIIKI
jgi:hypothetical protein